MWWHPRYQHQRICHRSEGSISEGIHCIRLVTNHTMWYSNHKTDGNQQSTAAKTSPYNTVTWGLCRIYLSIASWSPPLMLLCLQQSQCVTETFPCAQQYRWIAAPSYSQSLLVAAACCVLLLLASLSRCYQAWTEIRTREHATRTVQRVQFNLWTSMYTHIRNTHTHIQYTYRHRQRHRRRHRCSIQKLTVSA